MNLMSSAPAVTPLGLPRRMGSDTYMMVHTPHKILSHTFHFCPSVGAYSSLSFVTFQNNPVVLQKRKEAMMGTLREESDGWKVIIDFSS